MAVAAVTAANTNSRVNDSDASTGWGNLGGGGPAPASEPQLKYQGIGAVNRKVASTGGTRTGVQYDPGASPLDMTAAANRLWIVKVYVADFGDLNATYGVEVRVGSSSADYYAYNVAGSGANKGVFSSYPSRGGYLIFALDPNIVAWREATGGTPALTAVDYYGAAAGFVAGGAKSENFAMDAIDVGTGLALTGGDGVDTDGVFQDFVAADQNTVNNRWGYVSQDGTGAPIVVRGMLLIGNDGSTPVATGFTDATTVLLFPDGYHSAGLFGTTFDLSNASTLVSLNHTAIGLGVDDGTNDTRPDFVVTGTSGSLTLASLLINHRNVTLTSAVDCDAADIQCELLTQASAEIQNTTIRTLSASGVACLQDPTFGTTTGLHDTEFVQEGSGHALEIDTAATYDLTNIFFTGYGADTQNDAAIFVSAASGTVTLNINGGDTPTFRTAGATVVINNTVNVTLTGLQAGSEVTIVRTSDETVLFNVETSGTSETYQHDGTTVNVDILVFHVNYEPVAIAETLDATARSIPVQQIADLVYSNP